MPGHGAAGEAPGSVRSLGAALPGRKGAAREAGLGLASWKNFSRRWGFGAVLRCLAPGLGSSGQVDSGLAPESLTGEAICGLGLVSLHIEGKLCRQLFAISKNQLALGGVVPARSASAQDIKAAKMKNTKMLFIHAGQDLRGQGINYTHCTGETPEVRPGKELD